MKLFRTPSLSLQTPDFWMDQSTYVLLGAEILGFRPSIVVTMSSGVMDPYLRRHVEIQLAEMQKTLAGFLLLARSEPFATPHGQAMTAEFDWTSKEAGTRLHQYQMYFLVGQDLYTLTATAPSQHWASVGQSLIGIISTFQPGTWNSELTPTPPR